MKRILLLLLFTWSFATFAQYDWVQVSSPVPQEPLVTVVEQNSDNVIIDVSIQGLWVKNFTEKGVTYQRLEIIGNQTTQEVGKPELPMLNELIGIPGDKKVRVSIVQSSSITLENYLIYPFQTPTTDNPGGQSNIFVVDQDFYKQDRNFPTQVAEMGQPGIWRDVKVAGLHIAPCIYNPANKTLDVVKTLRLKIEFYGQEEMMVKRDKSVTPLFYDMYESKIINFQSLGFTKEFKANSDIKYLIITNTSCLANIQPLVDWKNEQGYKVEVRTMETGFNTPQNFKDYITGLFNSDDLEYVLMVGDAYPNGGNGGGPDDVPMFYWAPGGEDPSYSDSWYTCLDGPDDHFADLAIGRFTYDNQTELALQIQKTIDHYKSPDAATNWAENSILIAHMEEYPGKYTACSEEIRTFPYSLQVPIFQQAYGGAGYTNQQVVTYVNTNSCGILNYRGHGSATEFWEWSPSGSLTATHVNQMSNTDRLFVAFDVCCDNMDIVAHPGNCLCESFMKSPVASVAINSAIIPSYTIPNHDYDKEMYKAIFEEGILNIGYITNYANVTVLNNHGNLGRSNVRTYLWLGDASIEPWTLQPATMTVVHDPQLFLGFTEYAVNVTGSGGALENARVCVTNADQTIYGVGFTDATGTATVVFDEPVQNAGTAKVTVTAHNHLYYQADIQVIPQSGPYVVKDSYTLNDATGGNGDGLMDYGEAMMMTLAMKNVGIANAYNVSVNISTTDSYVTITDNNAVYGTINAGEVVSVTDGFAFNVANNLPDGHVVLFAVEANGNADLTWTSNLSIPGHAPILEMDENVTVSDPAGNNNGKIDPGETVNLLVTVENTGSSGAVNVAGLLSCSDPYITVNQNQGNYGNLAGGGNSQQSYTITASPSTPAGHTANFNLAISANLGITGSGTFYKVVGQIPVLIVNLDPTPTSGTAIQTAIQSLGVSVEYGTTIPSDLGLYSSVFLCLGIYSNNHVLSSTEGQAFADYLDGGGNLYMEGGDTWYYDASTAVHPMFNINATGDGSGDLNTIAGYTGTFTEGMSFTYSGENNWIDRLTAISPAVDLLKNNSPFYGTGVAYDAGTYRTVGCSHEFGGLTDGTLPSTKEELMRQYLIFFGIIPDGLTANFMANTLNPCEGNTVNYTDISQGGTIVSWDWTFEGGTPATSNQQNPVVTYNNPGVFDVTLTVSDGTNTNTVSKPDFITAHALPNVTLEPFDIACINWPPFALTGGLPAGGTYTGDGVTANMFDPAAAGLGTHTITYTYSDMYSCSSSATQDIVVDACTGINDFASGAIKIFPNPTQGNFRITLDIEGSEDVMVRIMNSLNQVIYINEEVTANGYIDIDLSGSPDGVYYLQVKNNESVAVRRIVVK